MATGNVPVQALRGAAQRTEPIAIPDVRPPEGARPQEAPEPAINLLGETGQTPAVEDFSPEQIREIASALGDAVGILNRGLRIQIDDSSKRVITQVIDRNTDEVVRQIPPQELLDIGQRLRTFVGTLFDEQG